MAPSVATPFRRLMPALVGVQILYLAYTLLHTLSLVMPQQALLLSLLKLVPGPLAVGLLLALGWPRRTLYLRWARLSLRGAAALALLLVPLVPTLLMGRWVGWQPGQALLGAADGVAQELFFRAALLPVCLAAFRGRVWPALAVQTVLFVVWHAGTFVVAPVGGVIAVMVAATIGGLAWGWQTQHDGTVAWAGASHGLYWVIGSAVSYG